MSDFNIRLAGIEELDLLSQIGSRTFVTTYVALLPQRRALLQAYADQAFSRERLRAELAVPDARYRYFLIETPQGDCAGYAQLSRDPPPTGVCGTRPLQLHRLYFEPAFQGRGAGRLAIAHLIALARNEGHDSLWAAVFEENRVALRFYRTQGFQEVGQQAWRFHWNGEDYADVDRVMERML